MQAHIIIIITPHTTHRHTHIDHHLSNSWSAPAAAVASLPAIESTRAIGLAGRSGGKADDRAAGAHTHEHIYPSIHVCVCVGMDTVKTAAC
mmetsp:Transcript_7141/g.17377  ORF Transcript_7141/g.17377 Transcript_7141/m.17377 type:complete len:91 (-) Transcript_7141:286-558(-)